MNPVFVANVGDLTHNVTQAIVASQAQPLALDLVLVLPVRENLEEALQYVVEVRNQ